MESKKALLHYSPCEISLIVDRGYKSHKQMLMYCFADLLQRNILQIEKTNQENPIVYVALGPTAYDYAPLIYEMPFLSVFGKFRNERMMLRNYVALVKRQIPHLTLMNKLVWKSPTLLYEFNRGWFARLFGAIYLSDQGEKVLTQLQAEITLVSRELRELLHTDPKAAAVLVQDLGARVLLIPGIDSAQLQGLESSMVAEFGTHEKVAASDGSGCSGGSCGGYSWSIDDDVSGAFDGGHGHGGCSSGDSGCGGSGCSGCGGGCGGCGG